MDNLIASASCGKPINLSLNFVCRI